MEDIIRKIMSIDKRATDIMKQTKEYLESKENDIRDRIETMKVEIMDKTKDETKAMYEAVVKEAEVEAEAIKDKAKADCQTIESKFIKIREKLENQLFSRIFG